MKIDNDKVTSILQFYLQDMKLEDKIMEALLDEDTEVTTGIEDAEEDEKEFNVDFGTWVIQAGSREEAEEKARKQMEDGEFPDIVDVEENT